MVDHAEDATRVRVGTIPKATEPRRDGGSGGGAVTTTDGLYVEDDGPGIPDEHEADVFEYGHSNRVDGTGLGLATVATIAEAHGWTVDVTEGTDGGARFQFGDVTFVHGMADS